MIWLLFTACTWSVWFDGPPSTDTDSDASCPDPDARLPTLRVAADATEVVVFGSMGEPRFVTSVSIAGVPATTTDQFATFKATVPLAVARALDVDADGSAVLPIVIVDYCGVHRLSEDGRPATNTDTGCGCALVCLPRETDTDTDTDTETETETETDTDTDVCACPE